MDFEAPNHGGNPFLCDDDYTIPTGDSAALNPFLSGGDFSMGGNENAELNPFLTGGQDDYMQQDNGSSASTNPFAMFGVEETDQTYTGGNDALFGANETQINGNSAPLFAEPATQAQTIDFFGSAENETVPTTNFFASPERPLPPVRPQPPVTAPTSLPLTGDAVEYCAETANIFQNSEESSLHREASSPVAPGRPPPPRPAPPSRETQQLILSVTGAMEATSSDLLDRLRATKTPSPTPIRDLHSPSPTPDANRDMLGEQDNDFLMGDDTPAPPPPSAASIISENQTQTAANFMDLFGGGEESNHNEPPAPAPTADLFGLFGAEEPCKPEAESVTVTAPPPPRPPVPTMVVKPLTPPQEADLLGDFSNVTEAVETTPIAFAAEITPPEPEPTPVPPPVVHRAPPPRPAPPPVKAIFSPPEPTPQAPPQVAQEATLPNPEVSISPPQVEQPAVSFQSDDTAFPAPPQESSGFSPPQKVNAFAPQEVTAFGTDDTAFASQQNANTYSEAPFSAPMNTAFQPEQPRQADEFDAFAAKFESAGFDGNDMKDVTSVDAFSDPFGGSSGAAGSGAWGAQTADIGGSNIGFGGDDDGGFDAFLSMRAPPPPVPRSTPAKRQESADSDEDGPDFTVVIKPKAEGAEDFGTSPSPKPGHVPILAPPPARSPGQNSAYSDNTPRFNPFDEQQQVGGMFETPVPQPAAVPMDIPIQPQQQFQRSDSQDTPQTPLFDEDVSQPLEDFPRVLYTGDGWEMHLRQPNKKKITGQRFWKKVFVRLVYQGDNPVMQLSNTKDDKDPFQELPLQPCYSISDIGAQQFDQYGKIFTVKLQYVFYKERPGVRPGQVTKAERITNKLSQFAAYAIQGDYQGVKEFGSDLRKLGLPVEHAPQISQLLKIGSQDYEVMKQFSITIEEALFRMPAHRDRALNYKMEEVQITAVDELYLEQDKTGHVCKQIARVRIFFLGFISGMPDLELGVNDIMRQGKEVVGRHDIIPVVTEEWIRLESLEFHSCVLNHEYEGERVIRFKPPDACYIELLRFRVRPPKNRELPLQTKATICVTGNKVEIKCDILVPGFSSRKLGQIPCEDIMLRIPIPESWIYLFRIEKHFRYGSVKSAHRRTGKIKGIERFLGTVDTMEPSLIEVTSGSAKYEHQHHAIVWRIHRLPKEGQGAYTNHEFVCRFQLTSYDQIPEELAKYCYLEFTMPSTQASHTTVRSLSVCGDRDEDPPEKCVRHLSRMEYRIEIEHTQGSGPGEYVSATSTARAAPEPVAEHPAERDSDSDSSS